jgi:hypothetical protein
MLESGAAIRQWTRKNPGLIRITRNRFASTVMHTTYERFHN